MKKQDKKAVIDTIKKVCKNGGDLTKEVNKKISYLQKKDYTDICRGLEKKEAIRKLKWLYSFFYGDKKTQKEIKRTIEDVKMIKYISSYINSRIIDYEKQAGFYGEEFANVLKNLNNY